MMPEIIIHKGEGYECNSYLILDEKNVLIDTGTGSNVAIKNWVYEHTEKLDMIVNTHAHLDHVGGNRLFDAPIAIHESDVQELESGSLYGTGRLFGKSAVSEASNVLADGKRLKLGEVELEIIHTPGHTPGGVCILSSSGHLFSGDTLFSSGSFGRTDLAGGDQTELFHSLERLKKVDFEFLMPGHMECVSNGRAHLDAAMRFFGEVYEGE